MADQHVASALRVPGAFCVDPTDLSLPYPHGGTDLGQLLSIEVRFNHNAKLTVAEEFGGAPNVVTYVGEAMAIAMILRGMEREAIEDVFPAQAAGASGGPVLGVNVGTTKSAVRPTHGLLFSPKAVDTSPMVYLPAAAAVPEQSARLQMSVNEEIGIASVWYATPDSGGWLYRVGLREDLIAAGALS